MTWLLLLFLQAGALDLGAYPTQDQCEAAAKVVQPQLAYPAGSSGLAFCIELPKPRA